jgi:hypothetical protein
MATTTVVISGKKTIFAGGTVYKTIRYVRDPSGQSLAIYDTVGSTMMLVERPIYRLGRIGMLKPKGGVSGFLYEVTDHIGNVRAVVGDPFTDQPRATLETANASIETANFLRLEDAKKVANPVGMGNNPVGGTDPDGGCFECLIDVMKTMLAQIKTTAEILADLDFWYSMNMSTVLGEVTVWDQIKAIPTEIGKTVINGIPNTAAKFGQAILNSGYFANAKAHQLTFGAVPLQEANTPGEKLMQTGGLWSGTFYSMSLGNLGGPRAVMQTTRGFQCNGVAKAYYFIPLCKSKRSR